MPNVTILPEPNPDGHTRYVLVLGDAPTVATIDGLIDFWIALHDEDTAQNPEDLHAVLVITPAGESEPVSIDKDDDNTWVIYQSADDGAIVEAIRFDPADEDNVLLHEVYVDTFTTDLVPHFNLSLQRS